MSLRITNDTGKNAQETSARYPQSAPGLGATATARCLSTRVAADKYPQV